MPPRARRKAVTVRPREGSARAILLARANALTCRFLHFPRLTVDLRRREWNRINAARSRARRKYFMACIEERREALVRENQAILALLDRSGVPVSAALLRETLDATASAAGARSTGSVPVMNATQMEVVDGGFVRLMQSPAENGESEGEASYPSPSHDEPACNLVARPRL